MILTVWCAAAARDPRAVQILLDINLYNTLTGLILVYVATHRDDRLYPRRVSSPRSWDLFDATRMDGYSDFEIFWRVTMPIRAPAIFTTVTLIHRPVGRVPVRRGAVDRRRQAHAAMGLMHFTGSHQPTSAWPRPVS
jgi:ABC-type maltose transport system permease subunit